MVTTLTVEPDFKSSGHMTIDVNTDADADADAPLAIGAVAALVDVATSTLRYYERRGLVRADSRSSGQRRYEPATVRRLVFVQMLQDAGLSLDEIQAVLEADDNASWKAVARERLARLDEEISRLEHARQLLDLALLCRFDHPLDECRIMNDEIDTRLRERSS